MLTVNAVDINWGAVVVSALAAWVLGAVWYAPPLLGKKWQAMVMAESKIKASDMKAGAKMAFAGSALALLLMAYVLDYLMGLTGASSTMEGLVVAAWAALGFVVTTTMIHALYHNVRTKLWAINTGYLVLGLLVMGAILGAWR